MKRHSLTGCILFMLSLASFLFFNQLPHSMGQDNEPPELVASYMNPVPIEGIGNVDWTSDGRQLVFADIALLPSSEWYTYDVDTKQIEAFDHSPQQNDILDDRCSRIEQLVAELSGGIAFLSPDGQFMTYLVEDTTSAYAGVGIASCQQDNSMVFLEILNDIGRVLWNSESTAFVITDIGNSYFTFNFYVSDYSTDISNTIVRHLDVLSLNNRDYAVNAVYDLSADGNHVLLRVVFSDPDTTYKLYLYDSQYPANDQLIDKVDANNVIAGSFAPNDETKLWLFTEQGVIQFDLVTEEITILDNTLTAVDAINVPPDSPALFSPDGRYLATLAEEGLYLIDLTEEAAQLGSNTTSIDSIFESKGMRRLRLSIDCSNSKADKLTWHIENPNAEAVTVNWRRRFFEGDGIVIVPSGTQDAPGEAAFETDVAPPRNSNIVDIFVDDWFHDTRECIKQ
jgi:hypothetical protein